MNSNGAETAAHLKWLRERASSQQLRPGYHAALHAVAAALVERRELGGEEVRRIIGDVIDAEIHGQLARELCDAHTTAIPRPPGQARGAGDTREDEHGGAE